MPGLKLFGLFIFLIVFSERRAQITEPALVQSAIPEDPDGIALSEQSSENITHINSDKLNGHLESESLEVVPNWFEKSAEKYSTEVDSDNEAVSENSQPLDSALVKNYKDDDILSFDLLSSTDKASYDEGTATKDLTDGLEHQNVINESATSGNSITIHGENANGDESYKFVNDYESPSDETTDEGIFSSSDPDDENDKELFESNDPTDGEWFKQDEATTTSYSHDSILLKEIEDIFTKGSSEYSSQTVATDIENDWERMVDVKEDESNFDSERINKSEDEKIDSMPSYLDTTSLLPDISETVVLPLNNTAVGDDVDIDTTTTVTAASITDNQENDEVQNISDSIDSSISTEFKSGRNDEIEEESAEIVTENNSNNDDETKDILATTNSTMLLRSTEPVVSSKTDNHISIEIKDDESEASNESTIRENITVVDNQESETLENFDKSTSLLEEHTTHKSEQINEPTSQKIEIFTEDDGIETTTNNEYSIPLLTTAKNLNENNDKVYILNKYNIEEANVPVEENKEFVEESKKTTTEKYRLYKTIDYEYSIEQNDTDSVESSTESVAENIFKSITNNYINNIAQETENGLVTDRHFLENDETEYQENEDAVGFNEPTTQQSVIYFSSTGVVRQDNLEITIEPTEIINKEYGSKTNENNENLNTTFDGSNQNTSSTFESEDRNEELLENEPIVSTTETDNEEVSTVFYKLISSDDNLHPNKKEETIEPIETHIEEHGTETSVNSYNLIASFDGNSKNLSSTVEIEDRSEEFSENEPILSTTEADNKEVTTEFYKVILSDDNLHPNKKEETIKPIETYIEEHGTETSVNSYNLIASFDGNSKNLSSSVEIEDRSEEFSENEPILSTTEADNDEISTEFYEIKYSDNLRSNGKEELELVENTTLMKEKSIENFTDSIIETIITTTVISRETHSDDDKTTTENAATTSLTTIKYNSNNENKTEASIEAMKGIVQFSQEGLEESTTETYNEETTTISYETSFKGYNYKEKVESESVESTTSVLLKKDITFNFKDSTTEEIISTTENGSDAEDNSNGAEAEEDLKEEEEETNIEESTTSILIEEKTVKYFTDGEADKVLTTTELSVDNKDFSEDNSEEINEPTSQRIGTLTEDYERKTTVNNVYSATDFKEGSEGISTTIIDKFLKENSEQENPSTKKYSIDKEAEVDSIESASVSIKEDSTSFMENLESNTTEEIGSVLEVDTGIHNTQTENNKYFSKDMVDVTESYVTVENNYFVTTETFTVTSQVTEASAIETSPLDNNKNSSYLLTTQSNIDYTSSTDDNEMNETVSTTDTFYEDYSGEDDIVIENESREFTQNETHILETVFVTTEKENTEKLNIETTTIHLLRDDKDLELEIAKIFDSVNDNVTKLINDSIKKLSKKIEVTSTANSLTTNDSSEDYSASSASEEMTTEEEEPEEENVMISSTDSIKKLSRKIEVTSTDKNSFTTNDSSEDYSASSVSEKMTTEEAEPEEENVMISSNEVSAINVSSRWPAFDTTSLGGRNNDYDQSVEDPSVKENEGNGDSNENRTVSTTTEESEPYIKGNVFGNHANVSIKIEIEDSFFHVPSNAYFDSYSDKHILNISWPSSHMLLNNSILLTLKENPELYTIQGVQLNLVEGNDFDIWNGNFTVQENNTFGKTNFVVELENDTRIYFSNLDFLRIAERNSEIDSNDIAAIPSAIKIDTKEIGIATGCIAAALFVCATIYFIISRSRNRVHIEDLTKNDIPV